MRSERARAAGANPSVAPVVTFLLLAEALLEQTPEFLEVELLQHL